jgi:hypothetical protein
MQHAIYLRVTFWLLALIMLFSRCADAADAVPHDAERQAASQENLPAITATSHMDARPALLAVRGNQVSQPISDDFFGIHIYKLASGWPYLPFRKISTIGTFLTWSIIQTGCNPNTYKWGGLDAFVNRAIANGADVLFTVFETPTCASSNPTDTTCAGVQFGPGGCDHPIDLNCDGTGTDQFFIDFVQAVAQRYPTTINYYEVWNEPDVPKEWSPAGCLGTPNAKWLMMARMAKDLRTTVQAINPAAQIVSASVSGGITAVTSFKSALIMAPYADILGFHGYQAYPEQLLSVITRDEANAAAAGYGSLPLWDTESSWNHSNDLTLDSDNREAYTARLYLMQAWAVGAVFWFGEDYADTGQFWSSTSNSKRGCTTPANNLPNVPGFACPAAPAYAQVHNWLLGNIAKKPVCSQSPSQSTNECSSNPPVGLWQVAIGNTLAVWDNALTCSSGTCGTESVSVSGYTRWTDLSGNTNSIVGGMVNVSLQPILLQP